MARSENALSTGAISATASLEVPGDDMAGIPYGDNGVKAYAQQTKASVRYYRATVQHCPYSQRRLQRCHIPAPATRRLARAISRAGRLGKDEN